MTDEQNLVYIRSQLLACEVELQAMIAENKWRESCGNSMAYGEDEFMELFNKYPIGHNNVLCEMFPKS